MNKYDWIDLKDEFLYWITGRPVSGSGMYRVSISERWEHFTHELWCLKRKWLYCPFGRHYVKWNSGNPSCIICWRQYNEIFK